ncbi:MAG TPA: hypothetical protein VKR27_02985, partial [Acidimicrobiales bacterium]|nr:hypothetical protein [Acidimicrobiales bacterium]
MGTRIMLAFVAVLAVALTLAGAVSFSLVRNAAADTSRKLVLQQDEALARTATNLARSTHNKSQVFSELLPLVSSVPGIKEASIVEVSSD